MSIDLSPEDLKSAESLVADGRFPSIQDAIAAGLQSLATPASEIPWTPDLQLAVDEGLGAAQANDFASEAELDALFTRHQQKTA